MTVRIEGMQFKPAILTVRSGDRVQWDNADFFPHTVTATGGAFDSGDVPAGGAWTFAAGATGTYDYDCKYHPTMKGRIIVR